MQLNPSSGSGSKSDTASDDHLIPLINIVFLMLIFFMIAGQISASDSFEVSPPTSNAEQAAPLEDISLLMSASGQLALNGESLSLDELGSRLAPLLDATGTGEQPRISLKVDAALTAQELDKVLNVLREARTAKVTLLTARVAL